MQQRPVLDILCILCIHVYYEPFAKFAIGNDMEAAKVMCCKEHAFVSPCMIRTAGQGRG